MVNVAFQDWVKEIEASSVGREMRGMVEATAAMEAELDAEIRQTAEVRHMLIQV